MKMMDNMEVFNKAKAVPDYAKKTIASGRMKGKTDISPMWRIQKLTEMFGPCGIGWWYVIKDQRLEAGANSEIKAFVDIDLYYKQGDMVSQPIPGIGGNSFVTKETSGLHTSDECFKMALSDAISVATKALGVAADVYMGTEATKYTNTERVQSGAVDPPPPRPQSDKKPVPAPVLNVDGYYYCDNCKDIIKQQKGKDGRTISATEVAAIALKRTGKQLCAACLKELTENEVRE